MNKIAILKTELALPAYSALTDEECLTALQAENIQTKQNIESKDIQKYLALQGKLLPLEASTADSAKEAVRMLDLFESFTFSEGAVETKLTAVLDALVADTLIDANDKAYILGLGEKLISRAEELGISVKTWEIEKVRAE